MVCCTWHTALLGYALPQGEALEHAAARELKEETSLDAGSVPLVQARGLG